MDIVVSSRYQKAKAQVAVVTVDAVSASIITLHAADLYNN